MTAESAVRTADPAALRTAVADLESRPMSLYRTLTGPAEEAERRAVELGDGELAQRAALLRVSVTLREGRSEEGGRAAHEVLAWARQHDRAYRALFADFRERLRQCRDQFFGQAVARARTVEREHRDLSGGLAQENGIGREGRTGS